MQSRRLNALTPALTIAALTGIATLTSHAAPAANELALKTEKVVVFKDGYCLVLKKATGRTDANGMFFTEDVPDAAVLGTFWALNTDGQLKSMTAGWETVETEEKKEIPCNNNIEILKANEGRECSVTLHTNTVLEGTIRTVLVQESQTPVAQHLLSSLIPGAVNGDGLSTTTMSSISGSSFVMTTKEGDVLLPVSQIRTLSIQKMKTMIERTIKTSKRSKRLTLRMEKRNEEHELTILYFRPGIRWIPTYRVNLAEDSSKKTAVLSLQAEILNEAEDLTNVPMDIVVGVPNFRFKETPSPFVLERTLQHTLRQAAPQLMNQRVSNDFGNNAYMVRSSEFRRNAAAAATEGTIDLPNELTASSAQDLFVYSLAPMDLKKGHRAAVQIFESPVKYRDVYTWDLQVKKDDISTAPSGKGVNSPLSLSKNEIWHQIELTNSTKLPWTTGAAMIMQGSQPLAQEMLTYTSPTDVVRIPVTISVSTKGTFEESETSRELTNLKWSGYHYAKIGQESLINVCNHKALPIDLELTYRVGGRVEEATDKGSIKLSPYRAEDWQRYRGHPAVNNSSTVRWKYTLKPGEVISPKVKYHYFAKQ